MLDRQPVPSDALQKSLTHFAKPSGTDLIERTTPFYAWQDRRRRHSVWPYARSLDSEPGPEAKIRTDDGRGFAGINFASQDYLGLTAHPDVREAGIAALREHGPHSAGSPALLGNTSLSLGLEEDLGEALEMEAVTLFPTGWAAGFGAITGLVRRHDHVVMDELAHQCLQQGAYAATRNVHRFSHLSMDALQDRLEHIRSDDPKVGILVVTESLFSMDSDTPNIQEVQGLCDTCDATLLLDMAHDFGAMGPGGMGALGAQGMIGEIDLVMGSFSKTFASNGGFVATKSPSVKQYLKYFGGPHIFSNALSPVQCAIVQESLQIVRSGEGERLRSQLMEIITELHQQFKREGIRCIGSPSPIIPVHIGNEAVARIASKQIAERGVLANLVEYPAVAAGYARFRLQAMATHTLEHARKAAEVITVSLQEAREVVTRGTA
jgi:glycine C-acetyltransferase/8-amino-7-oxononanoate synthase